MVTDERTFTLEEARNALSLVRRIAGDLETAVDSLTKLPGGTSFLYGASPLEELGAIHQSEAAELRGQIESLIDELGEIGVEIKGFQPVLIDFLSWRDGERVYLCWKAGEPDIQNWHSLSDGFRGRKPL